MKKVFSRTVAIIMCVAFSLMTTCASTVVLSARELTMEKAATIVDSTGKSLSFYSYTDPDGSEFLAYYYDGVLKKHMIYLNLNEGLLPNVMTGVFIQ